MNELLERTRREVARCGTMLTSLIEQGLRLIRRRPHRRSERRTVTLPECRAGGGTLPGADLSDGAALVDRMEDRAWSSGSHDSGRRD